MWAPSHHRTCFDREGVVRHAPPDTSHRHSSCDQNTAPKNMRAWAEAVERERVTIICQEAVKARLEKGRVTTEVCHGPCC